MTRNYQFIYSTTKLHYLLSTASQVSNGNVPVDEWKLDIVASRSQKGYMIPGPSFIAVSHKAWEVSERSKLPKF